jgi:DNA-binding IclR family transcriptional regulator
MSAARGRTAPAGSPSPPRQPGRRGAPDGKESSVVSLKRGLDILRAFHATDAPLGNTEIAERAALPKSTVARLTYTLGRLGYLRQAGPLGQYHLDDKVMLLGKALLRSLPIRQAAHPLMQEFADQHEISVALGAAAGTSMVYIEYCRGPETVTMSLRVGSLLPMGITAIGRAYLWGLAPEQREEQLRLIEAEAGGDGPAEVHRIVDSFAQLERDGFALSLGDWRREIYAVAAPLWVDRGQTVLALNCAARRQGLSENLFRGTLGPALVATATEITNALDRLGMTFWGE